MPARKFTDAEEQEIAKCYKTGYFPGRQIACAYGCGSTTIYSVLDRQDTKRRLQSWDKRCFTDIEERAIAKIYEIGRFSTRQIAAAYGCSPHAVFCALRRQDVIMRASGETRFKLNDREAREVSKIYEVGFKSTTELAEAYGVNHVTICNVLERAGVPRRAQSDAIKGERNGRWEGGKSFEPYPEEFWVKREAIRERDGRACQICGVHESQLDRRLDVHHIDRDKQNNDDHNLVSLCRECHGKTENGESRERYAAFLQGWQILRLSGKLPRAGQ